MVRQRLVAAVVPHRRVELRAAAAARRDPAPGRAHRSLAEAGVVAGDRRRCSGCSPRWPPSCRSRSPATRASCRTASLWLPPLLVAGAVALTLVAAALAVRRTGGPIGPDRGSPVTDWPRDVLSSADRVGPAGAGRRGRPRRPAAADRGVARLRAADGARPGAGDPARSCCIPLALVAVGVRARLRRRAGHRRAHRACTAGSAARCSGERDPGGVRRHHRAPTWSPGRCAG